MSKSKAKLPAPVPKQAAPPIVLPAGPWIERVPTGKACPARVEITATGLDAVRILAGSGGSQKLIAGKLSIALSMFKELMARDERVRVAWELGMAEEEWALVRGLRAAAADGQYVPALFLLKTRHNFIEGAAPPSTAPNIIISLPDSRSPQDYLRIINEVKQ